MSEHHNQVSGARRGFAIAAGIVLVALFGGVLVAVDRNAGQQALTANATPLPATPVPVATGTPTAVAATTATAAAAAIPFADCTQQHFGSPLAPSGAPADIHKYPAAPAMQINVAKLYDVTITTAKGTIKLCLQPNLAPITVNNFVVLARNHFFDGLKFHRVVADFVIQGGDPTGTGNGGPGYAFKDEPVHHTYTVGAVAMANSGTNTNGSQFFICTGSQCASLQPQYNLFGNVEAGLDVAQKIAQGDVMTSVTVAEQQ